MVVDYSVRAEEAELPIRIDCSQCGASDTSVLCHERSEITRLLFVIPVFWYSITLVICKSCGAEYTSPLSIRDLADYQASNISALISLRVSIVDKVLAVCSLLLCLFPFLGFFLSLVTVFSTWRVRSWWRSVGIVALVLSSLVTLLSAIIIVLGPDVP